jgi:hypothetical protein
METSLLFESFMIFYLLEVLVLVSVGVWYYKEEKQQELKIPQPEKRGPTASELIKMRQVVNQMKRGSL